MSNIASAKTAEVSDKTTAAANFSDETIGIRVSPNSYFIALFLTTFFSGFFFYLELDTAGIFLFGSSGLVISFLAWTDRITFDGKRLARTGILPRFWASLNGSSHRLKTFDIEQVETQALRALKRGGNVFYRYRTTVHGKNLTFAFASGGEEYRRMIQKLFSALPENALDNRSIELRDYLREPKETLMKAEFAKIPSVDVLENSLNSFKFRDKSIKSKYGGEISEQEIEKADYLHRLANELRLSGYLLQALEAFRRALFLNPRDARIIFDFARCLHSFAGSERDKKLARKAFAALRLAEYRAGDDGEMLARLGESYFQFGDWYRARKVFQKSLESVEQSFRSVRGLAEIALREGKIAHVIHLYATANRMAETNALRRWTQGENEYYSRLNDDEDYMEMEISRVNLLETLENTKKTALKIVLFGFPAILLGVTLDDYLIANIGWAISCISILIWVGVLMSQKMFSARISMDYANED